MTSRILFVLLALSSTLASAQDRLKFISIETGYDYVSCHEVEKDYLRADKSFDNYEGPDDYSTEIRARVNSYYGGVKFEVRSKNNRFGFLSGLRFTQANSRVFKNETPGYFYLLYDQNGTTTEYLRIEELRQNTSYLGIPLEVRWYAFKPMPVRIFFLAGGEVGVRLATKNQVTFVNQGMDKYESEVSEIIGKPGSFYSSFYVRSGLTFGKEKPLFSLAVTLPMFISTSSSLASPKVGVGLNLQIQKQL